MTATGAILALVIYWAGVFYGSGQQLAICGFMFMGQLFRSLLWPHPDGAHNQRRRAAILLVVWGGMFLCGWYGAAMERGNKLPHDVLLSMFK
ncbi:MAG: hypothetical protein JWM56_1380 [Candidatus Peribacteria bacterium]|nr:hypothetical protein [Candidatus Peribacteria bacterium]